MTEPVQNCSAGSGPVKNTDREIYHTPFNSVHDDSIHVTQGGGIGINVAGNVIVKPLRGWHALASIPTDAQPEQERSELTKIAAECHRTKWQFDFSDEHRLPVGQARDMVKRAFGELHRIGDMALKLREVASQPSPAATVETLNEQAREHPRYDNPRDPFASPDRLPPSSSADNADELKQCHDDLDTLNVPRLEGGLTLSVPGRILLMARRHRMTLPNADWLRRKTETDPDLECEAGPDLSRDGPQAVSVQQAFEECAALMQRWSDDAAEFSKDNERCQIQANVCRNAAVAIRNLSSRLSRPHSRIGEA